MADQKIVPISFVPNMMFDVFKGMSSEQQDEILRINIALTNAGNNAAALYEKQLKYEEIAAITGKEPVVKVEPAKVNTGTSLDDWLNNAVNDDVLSAKSDQSGPSM